MASVTKAYRMAKRWMIGTGRGEVLFRQDMAFVRPRYLKAVLENHPEMAGWNRSFLPWLNVWVLVQSPTSTGVLGVRPEYLEWSRRHDEAWSALLDERVEVTSPEGRG